MIKVGKSGDFVSLARIFNRQVRQSILREESVQSVLQFYAILTWLNNPASVAFFFTTFECDLENVMCALYIKGAILHHL